MTEERESICLHCGNIAKMVCGVPCSCSGALKERERLRAAMTPPDRQDGLVEALRPLVDLQHQKGAWSIIQKAASDFEPVTLTITKRQMLDLLAALASIEAMNQAAA